MIDLKPFCDDWAPGYALSRPWRVGDTIYATDSRVAVAVQPELWDGDLADLSDGKKRPKVDDVLAPCLAIQEWNDMPPIPPCAKCSSTGIAKATCSECMGLGRVMCNLGHEHDCTDCDDEGLVEYPCPACPMQFVVGNRDITAKILRKMAALPGVKWAAESDDCNEVLFVKFDGGYGAMLPLEQEIKRESKNAGATP